MKVLHLIYSLERGGAEKDLLAKAGVLSREYGVEEHIAVITQKGELAEEAEALGFTIHELGMEAKTDVAAVTRLRNLVRQVQPRVLHTHLFNAGLLGRMSCGLNRDLAIISTVQAIRPNRNILQVRADNYLAHATYKIIASSRATKKHLINEGVAGNKIVTIHNAVDFSFFKKSSARQKLRRELGIPETAPVLGCVSRLDRDKDLPTLIGAFRLLKKQHPEAHLVIVGEGAEREMLEAMVHQIGLQGSIHLPGSRGDVADCLAAFDVFALSSITESFGIVLVEALAAEIPVVATRVGGIPEVVDHGETGILVEPKNPAVLAEVVSAILSEAERFHAMACEGRRRVMERFSAERLAARQYAVYSRADRRLTVRGH